MPKKTFSARTHTNSSKYPRVNELVEYLPTFRDSTPENTITLKKTMISPSICLISLYGGLVEDYVTDALMFRANDPKAFADQITRNVLGQIFPLDFHPEFNQYVSVSTSLFLDRFRTLNQSTNDFSQAIQKIAENQEDFVTHEIDAVIYVHSAELREKWIEIKLFTCPDQSSRILEKHLEPRVLADYFTKNDFLGLLGFSLIYTEHGDPLALEDPRLRVIPNVSGSWMIHLLFLDQGVCEDLRSTPDRAKWLLDQIHGDLTDFTARVGLNKYGCMFKMTENFVKVVKMEQLLEDYKVELEQAQKEKEQERKEKEQERKEKEQERKEKEQERRKREKIEKENAELKRKLAELQQKE
jgi:hypothetical protein